MDDPQPRTTPPPAAPRPRPGAAGIVAYAVPRHTAPIDLALDGNEGPPVRADLAAALARDLRALVNSYPSSSRLQHQWAAHLGVAPACLRVTAGADEALDRIVRTFVGPGREMLTTEPTFEMLARYCRLSGGRYVTVPWASGRFPVDDLVGRVSRRTSLVAIVSPNNPTGAVACVDDVRKAAVAAPHAVVLVDLAYVEFADTDPTRDLLALPNVIVTRTLSKAWGLAGLRVGCAVGAQPLIASVAAAGNPYPVSGLSMALASAALTAGVGGIDENVAEIRREREVLTDTLNQLGADPLPSEANFVLARFRHVGWTWDALAGLGIAVRRFPGRPGLDTALRITCPGQPARFDRLLDGLRAALRPEAVLFDLDGVLADVSASYREAIRRTAVEFGVELTAGEIVAAKAAGGANDDWELTRRLIAGRGVNPPLEEVTRVFERIYQGTGVVEGTRRTERCLVERAWLSALASRLPLGIVTGRPRADATRFLGRAGVLDLFRVVVAMHDAPAKPDPAPVRVALDRLGVRAAWMIGDTPDDVQAARAAGVVPIGVLAPGDGGTTMRGALERAGCARVLASPVELEELLP